ncbi:hypothetical protein KSC_024750 [Ktedonobacter sp. SOSP1-52]|uniref:hypothetical protein n=1 Tax=Ktedonobacter sp. SOSP1-52 TaxID=2778366 RepID=UPI001915B19A|nr:hypothetical protein [Ktedonobacter sp. SOSP1-52]GHO63583.1 hypothetical protein KSC_024750 [Ktedonobacter sp. SOSP1-52]
MRNQGISLTYDRKAVKELIIEGLEGGRDELKDLQFQRIAFALGIDLGPTEEEK